MLIRIRGRTVCAIVEPIRHGYFLRLNLTDSFGVDAGTPVEVDGRPFAVRHIIEADAGEPEAWALVSPTENRNAHRRKHVDVVRLCE
jgi:hypothetical protein